MKVIETLRYNRDNTINDVVLYDGDDIGMALLTQTQATVYAADAVETRRNLFTTIAIRVEL
jgi:hypothetical protein